MLKSRIIRAIYGNARIVVVIVKNSKIIIALKLWLKIQEFQI